MQETVPVRVVERLGDRGPEPYYIVDGQRAGVEARLERSAGDVFHDKELAAVPDIEVEDGGYTRVRESGQHECFSSEALTARRIAEGSGQDHLDGDITVEIVVVCLPHLTHAALADALEQPVPAKDGTGPEGLAADDGFAHAGCHRAKLSLG